MCPLGPRAWSLRKASYAGFLLPVAIARLGSPSVRLVHTQESSHLASCVCANYLRRLPNGRVDNYHVIITKGSPGQRTAYINLRDVLTLTHAPTVLPGPVGTPVSCIASPGGLSGHLNDAISGRLSEAYCILMYVCRMP